MIDLTAAKQRAAKPTFIDYSADLTPFLGGPVQTIRRIGKRHSIMITMPPMEYEPDGRRWITRIVDAKQEDGKVVFPQPGFDIGAPGAPTVASETVGGMSLPITGGTPHYAIREGQALHVESAGRIYFYMARAQTILDASGAGVVALNVPLRKVASPGDKVELARPVVAGQIEDNNWSVDIDANEPIVLSFTVKERA